jgi:hypothetical protein
VRAHEGRTDARWCAHGGRGLTERDRAAHAWAFPVKGAFAPGCIRTHAFTTTGFGRSSWAHHMSSAQGLRNGLLACRSPSVAQRSGEAIAEAIAELDAVLYWKEAFARCWAQPWRSFHGGPSCRLLRIRVFARQWAQATRPKQPAPGRRSQTLRRRPRKAPPTAATPQLALVRRAGPRGAAVGASLSALLLLSASATGALEGASLTPAGARADWARFGPWQGSNCAPPPTPTPPPPPFPLAAGPAHLRPQTPGAGQCMPLGFNLGAGKGRLCRMFGSSKGGADAASSGQVGPPDGALWRGGGGGGGWAEP